MLALIRSRPPSVISKIFRRNTIISQDKASPEEYEGTVNMEDHIEDRFPAVLRGRLKTVVNNDKRML